MKGIALGCLFLILSIALGADFLAPHDPWKRFDPLLPPGSRHPLGTNDLGYDIFSELLYGSRVTLLVGFGAAVVAGLVGVSFGLMAGVFGGVVDEFTMGLSDIVLLIPRIPLLLTLAAFYRPSFWGILLVLGMLGWPGTARVVRSRTLQLRTSGFVQVNRCLGMSPLQIAFRDLLPNLSPVVLPQFLLTASSAMIGEASLSFLGLGDPSVKSWGTIVGWAFTRGGFINERWWWFLPPLGGILLSIFSVTALEYLAHRNQEEGFLEL